jgi:cell division protein ZapA
MLRDVKRSVTVSVANQQLSLKTDAKPTYVKELAAFVDEKLREAKKTGRTQTTQSLALLAALNIADELLQLRQSHDDLKREVRERSRRILQTLRTEATR